MKTPEKIYVYIPDDDIVGTASTQKGFPHQFVTTEYTRTDTIKVKDVRENNSVWHDITEEPQYKQNGRTDFIVDSYYGHIGRKAHTYDSEQWSAHLGFVENMEFRWAYEKDLIDF